MARRTAFAFALVAALALVPAACGGGSNNSPDGGARPPDAARPDASPRSPDAAHADAASPSADATPPSPDARPLDARPLDAAPPDAPALDAATPDAPPPDAPALDAAPPDAPPPDARALDAGLPPCTKPTNNALLFNGAQQVVIPDSPSVRLQDMTLEAWVNFAGTPGAFNSVVSKPFGGATADSFVIWWQSGQLLAGANPTNPTDAIGINFAPNVGQWYHVAFTFEHATHAQALYLDGVLVASGTATFDVQYDNHPVLIGADINFGGFGGYFDGMIDEVKLWDSVRDVTQLGLDLHSCTPGSFTGLAGYWPLDEGTGQTTVDLSGNANTGTLGTDPANIDSADPTWVVSTVPF